MGRRSKQASRESSPEASTNAGGSQRPRSPSRGAQDTTARPPSPLRSSVTAEEAEIITAAVASQSITSTDIADDPLFENSNNVTESPLSSQRLFIFAVGEYAEIRAALSLALLWTRRQHTVMMMVPVSHVLWIRDACARALMPVFVWPLNETNVSNESIPSKMKSTPVILLSTNANLQTPWLTSQGQEALARYDTNYLAQSKRDHLPIVEDTVVRDLQRLFQLPLRNNTNLPAELDFDVIVATQTAQQIAAYFSEAIQKPLVFLDVEPLVDPGTGLSLSKCFDESLYAKQLSMVSMDSNSSSSVSFSTAQLSDEWQLCSDWWWHEQSRANQWRRLFGLASLNTFVPWRALIHHNIKGGGGVPTLCTWWSRLRPAPPHWSRANRPLLGSLPLHQLTSIGDEPSSSLRRFIQTAKSQHGILVYLALGASVPWPSEILIQWTRAWLQTDTKLYVIAARGKWDIVTQPTSMEPVSTESLAGSGYETPVTGNSNIHERLFLLPDQPLAPPHAWIMERVDCVLHHADAETVGLIARQGVVNIPVLLMDSDTSALGWISALWRWGCTAPSLPISALEDANVVVAAIQAAAHDMAMKSALQGLKESLSDNALQRTGDTLSTWLESRCARVIRSQELTRTGLNEIWKEKKLSALEKYYHQWQRRLLFTGTLTAVVVVVASVYYRQK